MNCIKRLTLPRQFYTARLKRISLLLLSLEANVVTHGRRLCIKIGRDYPFRQIFYRAMAAMAALKSMTIIGQNQAGQVRQKLPVW